MMILFKKLLPSASLPKYAKEGDSGMDVSSAEATVIPRRGYGKVRTGLAAIIPAGYELQLRPRSGLQCNKGIVGAFGTIDNGYRGEIGVVLYNHTDAPFYVEVGDRVAQLVPMQVRQFQIMEHTGDMPASERGEAGFGSSGIK